MRPLDAQITGSHTSPLLLDLSLASTFALPEPDSFKLLFLFQLGISQTVLLLPSAGWPEYRDLPPPPDQKPP